MFLEMGGGKDEDFLRNKYRTDETLVLSFGGDASAAIEVIYIKVADDLLYKAGLLPPSFSCWVVLVWHCESNN
jgi:hypothetical protein